MSDEKSQQQEPTMEEILASIRRIISENDEGDAKPAGAAPAPAAAPEPAPKAEPQPEPKKEEDVLELTDMVAEEPAKETASEKESEPEDIVIEEPPAPAPEPTAPAMDASDLVSAPVAAASTAALGALAGMLNREPGTVGNMPLGPGNALEDLVRDMLRPMLREWLDQNLAQLVERLVKREIERMVRRAEDL